MGRARPVGLLHDAGAFEAGAPDASVDSDADGIPDLYESETGINGSPTSIGTDPGVWDTDGDGFGDELLLDINPNDALSLLYLPSMNWISALLMVGALAYSGAAAMSHRRR